MRQTASFHSKKKKQIQSLQESQHVTLGVSFTYVACLDWLKGWKHYLYFYMASGFGRTSGLQIKERGAFFYTVVFCIAVSCTLNYSNSCFDIRRFLPCFQGHSRRIAYFYGTTVFLEKNEHTTTYLILHLTQTKI